MSEEVIKKLENSLVILQNSHTDICQKTREYAGTNNQEDLLTLISLNDEKLYLEQQIQKIEATLQKLRDSTSSLISKIYIIESNGVQKEVRVVSENMSDDTKGFMSSIKGAVTSSSPLARAISSGKEGDVVEYDTPTGLKRCKIIAIRLNY